MNPLFSYSKTNSIIHKTPAGLKLLILLAVPVTIALTPIWVCISLMVLFLLLAIISRTGIRSFLRDLRPIIYYSLMIVVFDVLSYALFRSSDVAIRQTSIYLILKLICAIEASSVFFRTTSIHQTRDVLQKVESLVTFGHSNLVVSTTLSLFLGFLPQIFATWSDLDLAYRARGGRRGFSKAVRLLPLLIAMSIKKANTTYLALLNRS